MCTPISNNVYLENLPQVSENVNEVIGKALAMEELEKALNSMGNGKTPGIYDFSVEFDKTFWTEIGPDLLAVLNQSLSDGQLPRSCRRAVISLLPKKGDLNEIKNCLLCNDYKLLSKVLANRLGDVLDQIIHPDQTYSVPGRIIADNIYFVRDVLDNSKILFDFGLISIDLEKAFDRVEHKRECFSSFWF